LVAGIDAGLTQRSIDFLNLRYGTQHNGNGQFDPNLPSYEEGFVNNYTFGDISAGLLWFSMLGKDKSFWLGGAMHHLNRANQSFTENRTFEGLYTKLTLHGGADIMFTSKYGIVPNLIFLRQGPSYEVTPGAAFKMNLSKSKREYQAFQLGAWLRLANHFEKPIASDALILTTRFDYNNIGFGFSYDVNISSLQPASNNNGAFELNLQYKICNGFKRSDYCPAF
jgi:type IX secretion system PorP/SprF family membrane protein